MCVLATCDGPAQFCAIVNSIGMFAAFKALFSVRPNVMLTPPIGRVIHPASEKLARQTIHRHAANMPCPPKKSSVVVVIEVLDLSSLFSKDAVLILCFLVCCIVTRHMALTHFA